MRAAAARCAAEAASWACTTPASRPAIRVTLRQIEETARRELDVLTGRTGGVAFYSANLADIDGLVADLAQQIRRQYTIAYAPSSHAPAILPPRHPRPRTVTRGPYPECR